MRMNRGGTARKRGLAPADTAVHRLETNECPDRLVGNPRRQRGDIDDRDHDQAPITVQQRRRFRFACGLVGDPMEYPLAATSSSVRSPCHQLPSTRELESDVTVVLPQARDLCLVARKSVSVRALLPDRVNLFCDRSTGSDRATQPGCDTGVLRNQSHAHAGCEPPGEHLRHDLLFQRMLADTEMVTTPIGQLVSKPNFRPVAIASRNVTNVAALAKFAIAFNA